MNKSLFPLIFLAVISIGSPSIQEAPPTIAKDWSRVALQDLQGAYEQLQENHPGNYDEENPSWKQLLQTEYAKQRDNATRVDSCEQYQKVMRDFIASFKDGHLGIKFYMPTTRQDEPRDSASKNATVTEFAPKCIWISLPSFECNSTLEIVALRNVIRRSSKLRMSDVIVFDLRGNTGGSTEWGDSLLKHLFTKRYFDQSRNQSLQSLKTHVEWRASKSNIEYLKTMLKPETVHALNLANVVEEIKKVITGLEQAYENNQPFFKEELSNPAATVHSTAKNPVTSKLVLLTDKKCASASLDFIDNLSVMSNSLHIGESTNSDTNYMECRSALLPSNEASLVFPIKVYRNRIRKAGQQYHPTVPWAGDINDTQALQQYVLGHKTNN
jgi:hypothetical protein